MNSRLRNREHFLRIAIAGTHSTGKSTLAEELQSKLKDYELFEEPYHRMVEEGYDFPEVPTVEDFFEQLKVWHSSIKESRGDTIFDRSPLDFLAYALSLRPRESFDKQEWIELCEEALADVDAIILCPVEDPDRIGAVSREGRKLRARVDQILKEFLLDDTLGLLSHLVVIEVTGSIDQRVNKTLQALS